MNKKQQTSGTTKDTTKTVNNTNTQKNMQKATSTPATVAQAPVNEALALLRHRFKTGSEVAIPCLINHPKV